MVLRTDFIRAEINDKNLLFYHLSPPCAQYLTRDVFSTIQYLTWHLNTLGRIQHQKCVYFKFRVLKKKKTKNIICTVSPSFNNNLWKWWEAQEKQDFNAKYKKQKRKLNMLGRN